MPPTKLPQWLQQYLDELKARPRALEPGWQSDLFRPYVLLRGLGYPSRLVQSWPDRSDIRIRTPENIPHMVIEAKRDNTDLDRDDTLTQALKYLEGGESFVVLVSPQRLKVFTPKGRCLGDIVINRAGVSDPELWWRLSFDYMEQKKHLEAFRVGEADFNYIPVHSPEGFKKFVGALRLCGGILVKYVRRAWDNLRVQYQEYQEQVSNLDREFEGRASLFTGAERREEELRLEESKRRLAARYRIAMEVMEGSFPAFQQIQPYSRDVDEARLVGIYLTDVVYSALNRILLVRIAEDKDLVGRKISNGGVAVWRQFVTYLKDHYQDLLNIAYLDTAKGIYAPFFERGIFDWYRDSDSDLHEALELVFFILNAFDLSQVDRDTLGDLYQEYLPPKERKSLGEFYTPREVVDYILRHIGYPEEGEILDPACGSGGFLVRAIYFLLKSMEERGLSEESRLGAVGRVIGLDINPFASHIAVMNLLFLLLDLYLRVKERAAQEGRDFPLPLIPVFSLDSLLGGALQTTRSFTSWLQVSTSQEEAMRHRERFGEFSFVVMNPPYVRNERVPEGARAAYRQLFRDIAQANADLYTYFLKKGVDWLKDGGKLGVIVSYGVADSRANARLRKVLAQYAIERIVPLEWAPDTFASNINPFILLLRKEPPPPGHQLTLVHGIRAVKELDGDGGTATEVEQDRWLRLAPDETWRLEITSEDIPIVEKMKKEPTHLSAGYGMTKRGASGGREIIGSNPAQFKNPYPLLDGREVKAWSLEWQGRYIDYQPALISDPKSLPFFQPPKVLARRISLTTQVAVDEGPGPDGKELLAMDTVMVVRSGVKELDSRPYLMAAVINSLPIRYYAFLMLRAGVMEGSRRSTFYPRVFGSMPTPKAAFEDPGLAGRLEELGQQAHKMARRMAYGDKEVLSRVKKLAGSNTIPFAHLLTTDLRRWMVDVDVASAQVTDAGELVCENLTVVKGPPGVLAYVLAIAGLEGREKLGQRDLEEFPVPRDASVLREALRLMAQWGEERPTLSHQLAAIEEEINDLALSAFRTLTEEERRVIKRRATEFPLSEVLKTDLPGAPTRIIPVKYYAEGERYGA